MDLRLNRERLEYHACVLDRTVEDVFTADVVVPDSLSDVGAVLLADGDFCLWRLDLGSGSAEAEGEWKGSVVYSAEDDAAIAQFPVSVGIRLRIHDDVIEPELKPFAACRVTECTVQVMNSRKLRLKVRACMSLQGYAMQSMELTSGAEDAPADLFFKTEAHTVSFVTDVAEQVFTAGERMTLREAPDGRSILSSHSEVIAEPPQLSGSRAILHGVVRTTLLYLGSETQMPVYETVDTAFSQLLDLDHLTENDALRCRLQLTSAELIPHEGNDLETEFHIVVQTLCLRNMSCRLLTDAYSVTDRLEIQTELVALQNRSAPERMTVYAETVLSDLPSGASVTSVSACLKTVKSAEDAVSGVVDANVLYTASDGGLCSKCADLSFEASLSESCVLEDTHLGQPSISPTSGGMQLRVPIILTCAAVRKTEAAQITDVERAETPSDAPCLASLTLIPRSRDMDLWETAKRYCSSVEAIRAANPARDGEKAPQYCIIPRVYIG